MLRCCFRLFGWQFVPLKSLWRLLIALSGNLCLGIFLVLCSLRLLCSGMFPVLPQWYYWQDTEWREWPQIKIVSSQLWFLHLCSMLAYSYNEAIRELGAICSKIIADTIEVFSRILEWINIVADVWGLGTGDTVAKTRSDRIELRQRISNLRVAQKRKCPNQINSHFEHIALRIHDSIYFIKYWI